MQRTLETGALPLQNTARPVKYNYVRLYFIFLDTKSRGIYSFSRENSGAFFFFYQKEEIYILTLQEKQASERRDDYCLPSSLRDVNNTFPNAVSSVKFFYTFLLIFFNNFRSSFPKIVIFRYVCFRFLEHVLLHIPYFWLSTFEIRVHYHEKLKM